MKTFLVVSEVNLQSMKIVKVTKEDIDWLKNHGYEVYLKNDEQKETYLLEESLDYEDEIFYVETPIEDIFY